MSPRCAPCTSLSCRVGHWGLRRGLQGQMVLLAVMGTETLGRVRGRGGASAFQRETGFQKSLEVYPQGRDYSRAHTQGIHVECLLLPGPMHPKVNVNLVNSSLPTSRAQRLTRKFWSKTTDYRLWL